MYRVVIADDDQTIVEGLREELEWEKLGFEIVKTFNDGEELIEFLRCVKVDVVLTDIKMRHISGIDVARFVYNSELSCIVVFISAYKEFELAVQAMKYEVNDYILKPISDNEVEEVMRKIRKKLDKMKEDIELSKKTELYWEEMRPVLIKKFVNGLLMGALIDEREIKQRLSLLYPGEDLMNCLCFGAIMEIENYEEFIRKEWKYGIEQFHDAVDNFVAVYEETAYFHVVNKNNGLFQLFVISKEKCTTTEKNKALCNGLISDFAGKFNSIFGVRVKISDEMIFENICDVVNIRISFDHKNEKYENIGGRQERQKEILTNLMEGNVTGAQNIMMNSLVYFRDEDIDECKEFVKEVFTRIINFFEKENMAQKRRMEQYLDVKIICMWQSIPEIERYCFRVFDQMKSVEGLQERFDEHSVVNQIKEYIVQNIFEDICLEDAADSIFISTRHLTRIFKKHTEKTFLQYLTEKKMEKAAELLMQPQNKVWQVGEMLGYNTPKYFVKLFSSYYGCNPSEYRQEVLRKMEYENEG